MGYRIVILQINMIWDKVYLIACGTCGTHPGLFNVVLIISNDNILLFSEIWQASVALRFFVKPK